VVVASSKVVMVMLMWQDVQHSSCDVLRVGCKWLKSKQLQHRWKIPFLGMKKKNLIFVILKCENYPLILSENKNIPASGRYSQFNL
jgi:hypothetical protein